MKSAKKKKATAKKTAAKRADAARPPAHQSKLRPAVATDAAAEAPVTSAKPRTIPKSTATPKSSAVPVAKQVPKAEPVTIDKPAPIAKPVAKAKPVPVARGGRIVVKPAAPARQVAPRVASAKKKVAKQSPAKPAAAVAAAKPSTTPPPALPKLDIPAILFEGDESPAPLFSGPGQRYALAPLPPLTGPATLETPARLPESYGTGRLLLTARDPHWLYAHWDLSRPQQVQFNALSRDGHLVLRVFKDHPGGAPFQEVHLHPESRSWFVHVGLGGTQFHAELGYVGRDGAWQSVSNSSGTFTPPDTLSEDVSARFETLPTGVKFEELVEMVKTVVSENVPLMEALLQLRARAENTVEAPEHPPLPPVLVEALAWCSAVAAQGGHAAIEWTPEREQALAQIISMDSVRRVWMGSLEITELIRRQLPLGISSGEAPQFSRPAAVPELGVSGGAAAQAISSPHGGAEQRRGFWFNVNAELIIYGATEPNATVTIGGRKIKLRPDGSFSYRFALPDGHYELPTVAIAADETESRSAKLRFSRATEYRGEVAAHPQDTALKAPRAENL